MGKHRFITVKEAARILGCSPRTMRRILEKGHIRALKVGGMWRIDYQSLFAYIKRNSNVEFERDEEYYIYFNDTL